MKDITYRHQYIRDQLEQKGMIRVHEVAAKMGVTGATIRRDLRILESQHALQRGYGSAVPLKAKATDPPLSDKYSVRASEKTRIGRAAAALLEENDSILITSGSTIEAFVRALGANGSHNVVTASTRLAELLLEKNGFSVYMLGGSVVKDSHSVRDSVAIQTLKHMRCNKLFFSCDGLDLNGGVTSAYLAESQLNIAMMEAATVRILLADSSKIGKVGFGKTCDLSEIQVLVTDDGISRKMREEFDRLGVKVITA